MQFYIQMTTEMAPKKWSPTRCMLLFALWNSSIVGWRYRRGRSGGRVQRPTRKWLLWLELYFALFQQVWRLFLMSYVKLVFLLHSFFIAGKESGVNLVYNSTDQSAKTPVFSRSFKKKSLKVSWFSGKSRALPHLNTTVLALTVLRHQKKNCWTPLNKSANKEWRLYYVANGSKQCYG